MLMPSPLNHFKFSLNIFTMFKFKFSHLAAILSFAALICMSSQSQAFHRKAPVPSSQEAIVPPAADVP